MPIGLLARILDVPSLGTMSILVLLLSFGSPRNKALFLDPQPRPNISVWQLPYVSCSSVLIYCLVLGFNLSYLSPFGATTRLPSTSQKKYVFHERMKHLEIDCHLVWDQYKAGFILPRHVASVDQSADIFTKSLSGPSFHHIISKLGMVTPPLPVSTWGGMIEFFSYIAFV